MTDTNVRAEWIDTAERIGRRICRSAIWAGNQCTWEIWDWGRPKTIPSKIVANGCFYNGAAGIALFLAELNAVTGDEIVRRTAEGALRHSINTIVNAEPFDWGLHTGQPGVVLTAARCAHLWKSEDFAAAARRCFAITPRDDARGRPTDIVTGAAGAILALLAACEYLEFDRANEILSSLGEGLMAVAMRRPTGWSWPTIPDSQLDDLVGYAHGSAGISHALRALAVATGDGRYAFAADEATRYERRYFDPDVRAWHDLRASEDPTNSDVQRRDTASRIPCDLSKRTPRFAMTWCHGATGIGLARLRALDAGADPSLIGDVRDAASFMSKCYETNAGGHGLCHGRAGNAEFLMEAGTAICDARLQERASTCAMRGREEFELRDRPWPTTPFGERDLSLMTGEAGIGYFYLRMADASIPSVLAVQPGARRRLHVATDGYARFRDANVEGMFGGSLDVMTAHPTSRSQILIRISEGARTRSLYDSAREVLDDVQAWRGVDVTTAAQEHALRRDYARAELLDLPNDTRVRAAISDVDVAATEMALPLLRAELSSSVRLVHAKCASNVPAGGSCPMELLMRRGRVIRGQPLSKFATVVLSACSGRGVTLEAIVQVVTESVVISDTDHAQVLAAVRNTILSAWRAGIVQLQDDA